MMDPNIVKGASIIGGFLKGAYKLIWMGSDYTVGYNGDIYMYMMFMRNSKCYRFYKIRDFLQKTVCTEYGRGEYRYRLEGFPVG